MRRCILAATLSLISLPAYADIAFCSGTITDSSGFIQPWSCGSRWLSGLGSSITASGSNIHVNLVNYIWYDFAPPPGFLLEYSGETQTSATEEFVITGGTGASELRGLARGDYAAWHWDHGPAGASETYISNFVYPGMGVNYSDLVTVPFTFGVPFTLSLSDDIRFSGNANYPYDSDLEDITTVYLDLSVFGADGNPVPGASISAVPEMSSLGLTAALLAGFGGASLRRRWARRAGEKG